MKRAHSRPGTQTSEVYQALKTCAPAFVGVAIFSGIINLLMLTGSLYMLQIYDRVLSSRSVSTLIGISLIVLAAYILQGELDSIRSKMLARIGAWFDEMLASRVFDLVATMPLKGAKPSESLQPVRDLDQIRRFLSGMGPTALFDMPFMPIFFIGCFIIHPWLGWLSVCGGIVIIVLTLYTDARSRAPMYDLTRSAAERHTLAETSRRNAEAVRALGMRSSLAARYAVAHTQHVDDGLRASDAASGVGAFAKIFRMVLQSAVLGLGAFLVIKGEMSGGAMIAASIMMSRALAPIEIAVANWKGFIGSRQSYRRLEHILSIVPAQDSRLSLPAPKNSLVVQDVYVGPPGAALPVVQSVAFQMQSGQGLGLIGPSASGKSTLARALVGVWPTLRGEVRLDGATLDQWEPDALGQHIGYLPQDVELFDGTVAENISRFRPEPEARDIIAAAQVAGAHEMILQLPDGYDTRIGEGGAALSGGQRQRVALARALFGDPFLVVLDEPNASLDGAGDEALNKAILAVRQRGGVVVVITHRPAALGNVDLVGDHGGGPPQGARAAGRSPAVGDEAQRCNTARTDGPAGAGAGAGASRPAAGGRINVGNRRQDQSPTRSRHEQALRRSATTGLAVIGLFGGTIGLWAATSTLSGAVVAPGQFVVDSNVKKVQHPTGGIVGELRVREGDRVKEGDLLIRLDETVTRANLQVVSKQLDEFLARQSRLEAERDGKNELILPEQFEVRSGDPAVVKLMASERTLFEARRSAREGQKSQLRKRISQLEDEISGLRAQQSAKAREAVLIEDELKGVRELYQKNLIQLSRLSALERDAASIEGQRGQLVAAVAQSEGKIAETSLQIIQVDEEDRAEVMKELREIQARVSELIERRVAAEDQLKRIDIRSPSAGYVHQLNVHTIGGVISPAEPAMLIVPDNEELNLEARVMPQEIDQLALGQHAVVRVHASNARTTPELNGTLTRISRRRLPRPADRRFLLHDPRRAAARGDPSPRSAAPRRRHAGRGLRADRRPHPVPVHDQAAQGAVRPRLPGALVLRRPPSSFRGRGAEPGIHKC